MSMDVDVISEIWAELKRYVNVVDRGAAAESIVSILIDHDVDADEIRTWFKGDSDIKTALSDYLATDADSDDMFKEDSEDPDDDDFNEDNNDDWDN
jgi:hypothetical protein